MANIGETFLAQHRDMGVDISYVSDYVDNHQQLEMDLRENEAELKKLRLIADNLFKNGLDQTKLSKITENLDSLEHKITKLKKSVEQRVVVAADYLVFVKLVNQFRNLALDLQELFKTINEYSTGPDFNSDTVFEQHVQDKMKIFEKIFRDVNRAGQDSILLLKNVNFE